MATEINGYPVFDLDDEQAAVVLAALQVPNFGHGAIDEELSKRESARTARQIAERAGLPEERVGFILRSLSGLDDPLVFPVGGRYQDETVWIVRCAGADALDAYQEERGPDWPSEMFAMVKDHQWVTGVLEGRREASP